MNEKAITTLLLLALLPFVAALMYLSNKLLKWSERKCKWVKRQCRFLDAISADIAAVKESVEKIRDRASKQIGVSELNSLEGIAQSLRGIDVQDWDKKAGYVSAPAKDAVKNFEYLSNNRSNKLITHFVALADLFATIDNWVEVKRAAVEVEKHVRSQQELTRKLCELLEQTRERVWSLQERSVERAPNNSFLATKVKFDEKMGQALEGLKGTGIRGRLAKEVRLAVIKVKLVVALVKDLRYVRLESEIQRAWGEEAVADINEAQSSIFEATEAEERTVRYPILLGWRNWSAKSKIRRKIAYFDTRFSDLLRAKAWYGIEFQRRESKRHVRRRFQRGAGGRDVLAAIQRELNNIPAASDLRLTVSRVRESLESLEKALKDEKAEEGAVYARKACFDLLKNTALEVDDHLRNCGVAWKMREMERISTAVDLLQKMARVCSIKVTKDSCSPVGIDEDVHELVSSLVSLSDEDRGTDEPTVVSIVGMQGIGKTALAKEVMNHSSILNHFNKNVYIVRFSEMDSASRATGLLTAVGEKILPTDLHPSDNELWIGKIRSFLTTQPCVVILDDLPSKQAWDTLKPALPIKSKSVVIVTTGSKMVSAHTNPRLTHRMRLRTEEESWEFFTQLVQFPSVSDSRTKSLAKRVVARAGGLPLAIMHLGYFLFGKELKEAELTNVLNRDHIAYNQWSTNWNVNKDDFQSNPDLGKCFSYSELFPADVEIPARRLLALWVASGSVKSCEEPMNCLQDLVKRNMIQVVERKRNGDIKTCRFPSTLREIWVKDTRNKAARARSWSLFASHNRQLAYRFEDQDTCAARSVHGLNSNVILKEEKYPRAIMFFDTSDGNKPNEDIGNFLLKGIASSHRQFRELLVLDLEGVFRPNLPRSIGKLKKLTYLGLRWTFIETLPDSIGELSQLQTLDLKYTYVQTLPPSIWKLKTLQNLYLSENCRIKQIPKLSSSSMRNLQTLSGVFLDHEGSALSSGLNKLPNLQKLGVTISQLPLKPHKWLGKGIAQLTKLRSLSLRSISENGEPQELKLKSLSGLTSLTNLYLLGKLENQSVLSDLPQSLTEITLSASELDDDPVPMLTKLKGLKFLSLLSKAYVGTHMVFHGNHFPELLVLQIWSLPNLEILEIGLGAMPKLRELEIRICKKLRTTSGLTELKTLQELKLTNMAHHEQVIENDFAAARDAAARENSSERTVHCPSITKKVRKLLEPRP